MQHAQTQHTQTQSQHKKPPGTKSQWHPFSWRRMGARNAWILLAVAAAFVIIGLAVT